MAADKGGVDQVSRPMLVVLAAVVLLAGAWFTVLRPKSDDGASPAPAPAAQAPGVKGLSSAVDKAKAASAKSDAANAALQKATGGEAAAPATSKSAATSAAKAGNAAKPATAATNPALRIAAGDPSAALLAKVRSGKTLVMLFWNRRGSDDRAVRDAVRSLRKAKNIATAIAPIANVGDYQAITGGVQVLTAPTVLVIGKDHKAKTITGLTDAPELRQLVGDVRAGR